MRVFPTRVGVNRSRLLARTSLGRFPHPRGGEPVVAVNITSGMSVFPTRVGVNRELQ